jgi:hypothetical protein
VGGLHLHHGGARHAQAAIAPATDGHLVVWDLRPAFHVPITVLTGVDRALYLACDAICDLHHAAGIVAHSRKAGFEAAPLGGAHDDPTSRRGNEARGGASGSGSAEQTASLEEARVRLDSFVARGLAVKQETRYLALAVPLGDYSPPPNIVDEVYRLGRLFGHNRLGTWIVPLDRIDDRLWRRDVLRRVPRNGSKRPRQRRVGRLTPARFSITDQGELAIR